MSQAQRVFITGLSALSAAGLDADSHWASVCHGQSKIAPITQADLSTWTHALGGELPPLAPSDLLPDRKLMKAVARQDVLGIHAAMQAVVHSQMIDYQKTLSDPTDFNEETAVYVGSPGNKYFQQYDFLPLLAKTQGDMKAFGEQLFDEVHPMWLLRILPNNVLAYTGMTYGFKGVNHNITNHALGGMQAILEAYHAIRSGQAQRAVVVAYDLATEPQALFYYERLGVISARHLKPFDAEHDGTILGDGACALVLESESSVQARQAACYGEILGGRTATEAMGLFSIQNTGEALSTLIHDTLKDVDLDPSALDVIVAHGNGNPLSDCSEARAIERVFTTHPVPVTAFKWSMGHTICTSGMLDTVLGSYVVQTGTIPGIANLNQVAPMCAALHLDASARTISSDTRHAMIINRGFAGMNACLVIKGCV